MKAKTILEGWLKDMGLELKPSKTKISHTLTPIEGNVGFDFLGFTVRQFPVGKTHTGKNPHGKPLGFKTIIKPSKEAVKRHTEELRKKIQALRAAPQEALIKELNPIIRGWADYYRTQASKTTFQKCDHILYWQIVRWTRYKHKNKTSQWMRKKYWKAEKGQTETFSDQEGHTLRMHRWTSIQRYVKVRGTASPYDGNLLYWVKRLKSHPLLKKKLGRLLQKQEGKCRWCGLTFKEEDRMEIDHIDKNRDNNQLDNLCVLHRHCHDERHAKGRTAQEVLERLINKPGQKPPNKQMSQEESWDEEELRQQVRQDIARLKELHEKGIPIK